MMDERQRRGLQQQKAHEVVGMLQGITCLWGIEDNATAGGYKAVDQQRTAEFNEWCEKVDAFCEWLIKESPIA